ncbi:MAG: hypothetical protein ABIG89_05255 [Candidatus Woesearchaeota archaeon]
MKIKHYLIIFIGLLFLTGYASAEEYIPGRLYIEFYEGTTVQEANYLVESNNLNWLSSTISPSIPMSYIRVPIGEEQKFVDILNNNDIVKKCQLAYVNNYAKGKVTIMFKEGVSVEEQNDLISSYNLTWEGGSPITLYGPPRGNAIVPEDQEIKYITMLEKENIVKYVDLDPVKVVAEENKEDNTNEPTPPPTKTEGDTEITEEPEQIMHEYVDEKPEGISDSTEENINNVISDQKFNLKKVAYIVGILIVVIIIVLYIYKKVS